MTEVGNKLFEPMPVPNYKKVKTKDIRYDPNTGEAISPDATKFDPKPVNYYLLKPKFLTQILEKK